MLRRFIADRSLFTWLVLCLGATICALIILDLPAELQAWDYLSARGVPAWAFFGGLAIGWARNSTFWSWLLIVGVAAVWLHRTVLRSRRLQTQPEVTMTTRLKAKRLWYVILGMLPIYSSYNGANPYGFVDGVYQKLPFSLEGALIGFFAGIVLSGILYAIGLGLTRLLKIIRFRTSA
ncbi:MAG: hypothetical protein WA373_10875 [Burkholderiales bacterium]